MNTQVTVDYNEIMRKFEDSEFWKLLGLEFVSLEDEKAYIRADYKKEYLNIKGTMHGGIILTLLDIVMGAAGLSKGTQTILTLQLETRFLKAITEGYAHAYAHIRHYANNTVIIEGSVKNDAGELVALSTGTFKFIH